MRIVAGAWRGRGLTAPPGQGTRPTADRVRQAVFDRLLHAPWGGRAAIDGVRVLDGFAGTGAFGLEALSRGAGFATFMEQDRGALSALRENVRAFGAEERCRVLAGNVLRPPAGEGCGLVFLDPPYHQGLLGPAVAALGSAGWIEAGSLVVMEAARDEALPEGGTVVSEFAAGAARVCIVQL